jgi:deoxyadenosine/deoxycytidine kinase
MAPGKVLVVEGSIAVGKSTLCEGVAAEARARGLRVAVLAERCTEPEDLAMLRLFCSAMAGGDGNNEYAAPFQDNRLMNTVALMEEAWRLVTEEGYDLAVVDRGVDGSMCFANEQHERKNISAATMEIYALAVAKSRRKHPPAFVAFVFAPALACERNDELRRARDPDRDCEKAYSLDYYESMGRRHEERADAAEAEGLRVGRFRATMDAYVDPVAVLDAALDTPAQLEV